MSAESAFGALARLVLNARWQRQRPPDEMPLATVVRFGVVVDEPALGEIAIHACIEDDSTAGPIEADCEVLQ